MSAKSVRVSRDGVTFYELPGTSADLSLDSSTADDSIFGTNFSSIQATIINWSISSNGLFKGFPGYKAQIKRAGTPTAFTSEATTQNGDYYYITDRAKSLWDHTAPVTVNDSATPVDASNIETIDYLNGGVKFVSGYTVTGPITVTGSFMATTRICFANTFDLSMTADIEAITTICDADDNNGFTVNSYNQQSAELSMDGFYSDSNTFIADLLARDVVIIEVDPAGDGSVTHRGYYMATSQSQSGDVGSTETESITYSLFVPEGVPRPFSVYVAETSALPDAVREILLAWQDRATLTVEYTAQDSTATRTGEVLVSDSSLSGGVDAINDYSFTFDGTGALT